MNIASAKYSQDLRRFYRLPSVQVSLTVVLSFFVSAFFIAFALRPTIISITSLKKNIVESEKTLKTLELKVTNLQKASTQLESIQDFLPLLNREISNQGSKYNSLVTTIEAVASQTNVTLDSESLGSTLLFSRVLSPFTPNKNQKVVVLPLSVRVIGSYTNVYNFLSTLSSLERIIFIESVTITRETNTKNASNTVSLNLVGNAYYLADEGLLNKAIEVKNKK